MARLSYLMASPSTARGRTGPPARVSLRQSADPRFVLADRVEQLYSQMPLAIIATLGISILVAYELYEGRYEGVLAFWGMLVAMLTAARTALYLGFRKSATRADDAAQWLRWMGLSALTAGATWGFAGAVFFPAHADVQQVFLALVISILVAGGIPLYAVSWPAYPLYAAGILFPFTYVLATFGNKLFPKLALIGPAYHLVNSAPAYRPSGIS